MTSSLQVRAYQEGDRDFFLALVRSPDRMKHMDGALSEESANALFESFLPGKTRAEDTWIASHSGEAVGHCALVQREGPESPELLFMVSKDHEGRGFATVMAQELITKARDRGLRTLWATVDEDHGASQAVLSKAGFEQRRRESDEQGSFFVYSLELRPNQN